ncbi:hypothetical protein [Variovorax saccharolyticus]|uniref:hypothetical protein n=1 Tax=Variovorax saccharolyticus TaxID=3053516 RepID=UPI002578BED7|nr:hypothetical protein [Variovorax sp. J22R187]MDM0021153.1 hypothetical protein [Variovorax sp. J22R187]
MSQLLRSIMGVALALGACTLASQAAAQADTSAAAKCSDPRVDRAACLREAAAAEQAKRQGTLNSPGGYEENALLRCERQPEGAAREACIKRVQGEGNTETRGSVPGGGVIRRTETPLPAPKN